MGIFVALLVLSFLIFFHELGHFLVAKLFGVKVEVFSIGFGKKVFKKRIGKTVWTISAIPLGGYVKMKGQDDTNPTLKSSDNDSYTSKKPWQRILILLAGPFANFFVAFILYFGISQVGTYASPLFNYKYYLEPIVGFFAEDSPAQRAGIKKGDRIVRINGVKIDNWESVGETIQLFDGTLKVDVVRNGGEMVRVEIEPIVNGTENKFGETVYKKMIGIAPKIPHEINFSPMEGMQFAWNETVYASKLIFLGIEKLLTGAVPANQVSGVIGIVDITAKASQSGIIVLFFFTALISVNLGILNLLPIPALDGGHIVFNFYEMVSGKVPSEKMTYGLTLLGWVILIFLMLLGLYNDINRFLG